MQYLAKGREIMKEEFICLMIEIDQKQFPKKKGGSRRVINKLKESLESCNELTDFIEMVKRKYTIPWQTKYSKILISLLSNVVRGCGFVIIDLVTDGVFTNDMNNLYQRSKISNHDDLKNCPVDFEYLRTIENTCKVEYAHLNTSTKCREVLKKIFDDENCSFDEINRFQDVEDWNQMFTFSLLHMILPITMYFLCSLTLYRAKKSWWKVLGTFPLLAKFRIFLLELNLYQTLSHPCEDGKEYAKTEKIKHRREEIKDFEENVTLALSIEAAFEASFQFFFQTLYRYRIFLDQHMICIGCRLPIFLLGLYHGGQYQQLLKLLNLRNLSILASFVSLSYSFYAIR